MIYLGVAVFCLASGGLAWRLACSYVSVPWPFWLAWFLENPYMRIFCHPDDIVERLDLRSGMHVLDLGCGAGRIALPVAKAIGATGQLTGVDMQENMLNLSRRKMSVLGLVNTEWIYGRLENISFDPESYDRVLLVTVLGEVTDRPGLLAKVHRLLKPGGLLSVTEVLPDPCYQSMRAVINLAQTCGFELDATYKNAVAYTANFRKRGQLP